MAAPTVAEATAWQAEVTKKVEAEALLRWLRGILSISKLKMPGSFMYWTAIYAAYTHAARAAPWGPGWIQARDASAAAVAIWVRMTPLTSPVRRNSRGAQSTARNWTSCASEKTNPIFCNDRPRWWTKYTLAKGGKEPVTSAQTAIAGRNRRKKGLESLESRVRGTAPGNLKPRRGTIEKAAAPQANSSVNWLACIAVSACGRSRNQPGNWPATSAPNAATPMPEEKMRLNAKGRSGS